MILKQKRLSIFLNTFFDIPFCTHLWMTLFLACHFHLWRGIQEFVCCFDSLIHACADLPLCNDQWNRKDKSTFFCKKKGSFLIFQNYTFEAVHLLRGDSNASKLRTKKKWCVYVAWSSSSPSSNRSSLTLAFLMTAMVIWISPFPIMAKGKNSPLW